jgi:hypothetical protein
MRLPLRTRDRWHLAAGLLAILAAIGGISAAVATNDDEDAVAGPFSTRTSPPVRPHEEDDELEIGDCVAEVRTRFEEASCSTSGAALVMGKGTIATRSYPTETELQQEAERICPSSFATFLYPTAAAWGYGDRTLLCLDR